MMVKLLLIINLVLPVDQKAAITVPLHSIFFFLEEKTAQINSLYLNILNKLIPSAWLTSVLNRASKINMVKKRL